MFLLDMHECPGCISVPLCCQVVHANKLEELSVPLCGLSSVSMLEWTFRMVSRKQLLEGMVSRRTIRKTWKRSGCLPYAAGHVQVIVVA